MSGTNRAETPQFGDFVVGQDKFEDLEIRPALTKNLHHLYDKARSRAVKQFVLIEKPQVTYLCGVTLVKKDDRLTPRLELSVRDRTGYVTSAETDDQEDPHGIKARINLDQCHEPFWSLLSYLQSLRRIEVPKSKFSLVSEEEGEIVTAIRERGVPSLKSIIAQLSETPGLTLSNEDINQLLRRREKLAEFQRALKTRSDEKWWQSFFEENKWIFGYGLNYQILRHEQSQPHLGGTAVSGRGGKKGDYLTSTGGDVRFTVLVEIKTPVAPLLQGSGEIRSGAWSLSKQLTDSLSQIQASVAEWAESGSRQSDNLDRFEGAGIYTIQPKGIVVIGSLSEVKSVRSKRETFQRFRSSIHGIDLLTFDELHSRAKFIVEQKDSDPPAS
jgi:hypothetical protein